MLNGSGAFYGRPVGEKIVEVLTGLGHAPGFGSLAAGSFGVGTSSSASPPSSAGSDAAGSHRFGSAGAEELTDRRE
jgi:hypothetical protein